ncbi:MAG: carbohydrate ABC transporter permease [Ruminiclostridium sp.]|nr:carbohydrate ABC transporter permease [Ruminiclostridium sp.]
MVGIILKRGIVVGKTKKSIGSKIFDICNITLFVLFCITILYPIYEIVVNSFSTETEIVGKGFRLMPYKWYFTNWKIILSSALLWKSFYNSVYVTVLASLYSMFLSATYAYPLSRKDLPDRNFWTFFLVFTMFFSGGLIPYYLLMNSLKLVNTLLVLIIGSINVWNTLIMRNYFMTIPDSLQESAKIDGASEITILRMVVLPLSLPVLATVLLWNLVANWNSWVSCLIYVNDPNKQVVQIVLQNIFRERTFNILSENTQNVYDALRDTDPKQSITNYGLRDATFIFVTLPILASYPFLQKYFVKGIMIGSLKG